MLRNLDIDSESASFALIVETRVSPRITGVTVGYTYSDITTCTI